MEKVCLQVLFSYFYLHCRETPLLLDTIFFTTFLQNWEIMYQSLFPKERRLMRSSLFHLSICFSLPKNFNIIANFSVIWKQR